MLISTEEQLQGRSRVVWLDYAKAIGIFFVVWGHEVLYTPREELIYRYIYAFHIPLFFILSGIALWYRLNRSPDIGLGFEIKRRAGSLLLPYAFWCGVQILLYRLFYFIKRYALAGFVKHELTINTLWEDLYAVFTGHMDPLWFLYTLFLVEIIFLVVCHVSRNDAPSKIVLTGGGTAGNGRSLSLAECTC